MPINTATRTVNPDKPEAMHDFESVERAVESLKEDFGSLMELPKNLEGLIEDYKDSSAKSRNELRLLRKEIEEGSLSKQMGLFFERLDTIETSFQKQKDDKDSLILELQKEIENSELRVKNNLQELELAKQRQKFNDLSTRYDSYFDSCSRKINSMAETVADKCREIKAEDQKISDYLDDFYQRIQEKENNSYEALKASAIKILNTTGEQCSKILEEFKTASCKFLDNCEKQNESLVKKIPGKEVVDKGTKRFLLTFSAVSFIFNATALVLLYFR